MSSSQSHPLPAKPPRPHQDGPKPSFGFKRASGVAQTSWQSSPTISSAPTSYSNQYQPPSYPQHQGDHSGYYGQQSQISFPSGAPQIKNPFVPVAETAPPTGGQSWNSNNNGYDADYAAQVAQWQASYASKEEDPKVKSSVATPNPVAPVPSKVTGDAATSKGDTGAGANQTTVLRSGGGTSWQDSTLLEWDPAHFRLFVGNLAGEVTDDSMMKAFSRYSSVQKARVIRDKRTTKSKGYGFVSFSDGDDYFRAAKEMQGKYIGSHPVTLRKATTEIKPTALKDKNRKNNGNSKGGKSGGGPSSNANTGAGVHKKPPKTRDGLKILG